MTRLCVWRLWGMLSWMAIAIGILGSGACHQPAKEVSASRLRFAGKTMGTTYSVSVVGAEIESRSSLLRETVERVLDEVDRRLSTYRNDSELSRWNRSSWELPFELSAETFALLERALEIGAASGGLFDITVGPLVNSYGFGPEKGQGLPSRQQLAALRQRVGHHLLELDPDRRRVRKLHPELYCDLSGIAKGYAVDRVAEALAGLGVTDYLIEVGGEMRAAGRRGDGELWQVGIEWPAAEPGRLQRIIALDTMAIATSGDYRNVRNVEGRRVHHLIDPRSGQPTTHALTSVSVLGRDCASADAWATALMIAGPEEGWWLAEQQELAVLLTVRNPDGSFDQRANRRFVVATTQP